MVALKTLLAALFVAGSFEPLGLWFLAPVGYALWIHTITHNAKKFSSTFLFGFISNAIILQWSGVYVGSTPWIALSLLQALYLIPVALIARRTSNVALLIFAVLITEEIRSRFPFGGFGWTRIAFSQSDSPLAPLASIGGVALVTFSTLLLSWLLISPKRLTASLVLSALLISYLSPVFLISSAEGEGGSEVIRVRAVQGGTPSVGLDFNSRALGVLKMHISQSLKDFIPSDDLILWPENAIDIDPINNPMAAELVSDFIQKIQRPLLAGAIVKTEQGPVNAVIYFDNAGDIKEIYRKRYLTPFGEYIPLRAIAEKVNPYADNVNDFFPGSTATIFRVGEFTAASVICYEIINDGLVRQASQGSDFLFIHTNSATFAGTAEGEQQLAITQFRAIEHHRSVLSVSTTGPSAYINDRGVVVDSLNEGVRGSLSVEMSAQRDKTISSTLGGVTNIAVMLLALVLALFNGKVRRRSWR